MAAIGIDLGTSYTCFGILRNNKVEIISNDIGNRTTPTYISFTEDECYFGDEAKNQASINPENTIFDFLRYVGLEFTDPIIQKDKKYLPYTIIEGDKNQPLFSVKHQGETKNFYVENLITMFLRKIKEIIQNQIKEEIKTTIISVPSNFNMKQRQCIKKSAEKAGLNVFDLINSSALSCITFGLNKKIDDEYDALIIDIGGGTTDVSLFSATRYMFEVLATAGDNHLGGEDFDNNMIEYFADRFQKKFNCDLRQSPRALRKLRTACENAKKTLSTSTKASIICDSIYEGHDLIDDITRSTFEKLNNELFKSTINVINKVFDGSFVSKNDISYIILVGGSSRIPRIQQLLQEFFNGQHLSRNVNPDEAVAYGAALKAAMIDGNLSDLIANCLLLDCVSLSLGVEVRGKKMIPIICKNYTKPAKKFAVFTTYNNNQTDVSIKIYEGENSKTRFNNLIGVLNLSGIPPKPRYVARIEITFNISNLDLKVSARDKSTGISNSITIDIDNILTPIENCEIDLFDAKTALENLLNTTHELVLEDDFSKKMSPENIEILKNETDEIINWMENLQHDDPSVYEEKLIYLENKIDQITQNDSKKELKNYCISIRDELTSLVNDINYTLLWIENTENKEKYEYKDKQKDIENKLKLILQKSQQYENENSS